MNAMTMQISKNGIITLSNLVLMTEITILNSVEVKILYVKSLLFLVPLQATTRQGQSLGALQHA